MEQYFPEFPELKEDSLGSYIFRNLLCGISIQLGFVFDILEFLVEWLLHASKSTRMTSTWLAWSHDLRITTLDPAFSERAKRPER